MKLMGDKKWRALWLEIAESFDEKPQRISYGFCGRLNQHPYYRYKLSNFVAKLTLINESSKTHSWLYETYINNPDPVRAFTACFIAEIGEKEFYRLAEEQ